MFLSLICGVISKRKIIFYFKGMGVVHYETVPSFVLTIVCLLSQEGNFESCKNPHTSYQPCTFYSQFLINFEKKKFYKHIFKMNCRNFKNIYIRFIHYFFDKNKIKNKHVIKIKNKYKEFIFKKNTMCSF